MKYLVILALFSANVFAQTKSTEKDDAVPAAQEVASTSSDREFKFVIGANGFASTIDIDGVDGKFTGAAIEVGFARYFESHRLRFSLLFQSYELEELSYAGTTIKLSSTPVSLDYTGVGLGFNYTYFVNDAVGFGGYLNHSRGDLKGCDATSCSTEDGYQTDIGARVDFKVGVWTPFIGLGATSIGSDGESYSGVSAYVGLLNFEF